MAAISSPVIYWVRLDLRLSDNPALKSALERPGGVIPVYIHDSKEPLPEALGAASRWWLHHALADLQQQFKQHGLSLIIRQGSPLAVLQHLIYETQAHTVTWNRRYEPTWVERDKHIYATLKREGIEVLSFNSALLFEPFAIKNKAGSPFQVFTPYWKHCQTLGLGQPTAMPPLPWARPAVMPKSESLVSLQLLPTISWDSGLKTAWAPTRLAAENTLHAFVVNDLASYAVDRDIPSHSGTSRLSPYLHFGQIGPREVIHALNDLPTTTKATYESELGWREFAHHLLWHFPHTPQSPLKSSFTHFPWHQDEALIAAWQKGLTGIPIVDAGMRQLWQTGWMHNRVRMVVASFLVKHLLQPWQVGAAWFWDTLVDADLASNTLGWQWSAGCGADAAPYFRVFNPVLQGQKFDPSGTYVMRYVPELKHVPLKYIHCPWEAPSSLLESCGVVLGKTYPQPLVLPSVGRDRALAAYDAFKKYSEKAE